MKVISFKLQPGNRFHFGKFTPDANTGLQNTDDIFHSDSLFSALIITYNSIFNDTNDFVEQFRNENLKISSLFFFLEYNNQKIFFLPKPLIFNFTDVDNYKDFKKIKYISKYLYEKIKDANELLNDDIIILQNIFAVHQSEMPVKNAEKVKIFNRIIDQKVFVSKEEQGDDLYQLDVIEIADNSLIDKNIDIGFYFIFDFNNDFEEKYFNKFISTIEILTSNGIGAEKSTIGQLHDYEISDIEFRLDNPSKKTSMSLSLINPTKNELEKILLGQSILRGGRIIGSNGNKRLKVVRMLTEGSITKNGVNGILVDIAPDNWNGIPYLRNGKAFLIPINENFENYEI
ncbi:MAG: type III-A CRISPR-associated RAMP protein Csm4 [Chlorobi bacterium]|nr:type III-A CRISPR-associated RAMP protein Csm4 [Chlorobiota bacterium]